MVAATANAPMSPGITCVLHHVHLFASDLDASIRYYCDMLGAEIAMDAEVAGARNVLLRLGPAHINFYDQPPRDSGRGAVHHLGIATNNLAGLVVRMREKGVEFRKGITDVGVLRYVRTAGPDGVLLELFETSPSVT